MKTKFSMILTILVLISVLMVGACAQTPPSTKPPPIISAPTTPQPGGTLTLVTARLTQISGYPPDITAGAFRILLPCLQPLLNKGADGLAAPWLATAWTVAPDKKSITLTLRKGVKFHDGTDFNAEAVKENLTTISLGGKGRIPDIASIDVVDDYTVRLNLSSYKSTIFLDLTRDKGLMISPTAFKTKGMDWIKANPVGTGPFKFVSQQRDVNLKFARFDNYWDKGKPYLDAIEWKFFADDTAAKMSFLAGEAQIFHYPEPINTPELKSKGYVFSMETTGTVAMAGDTANPNSPYANKKVREAVEYALDRKKLADAFGYGTFEALTQLAGPGDLGYIPGLARDYDPKKAKQLLSEAGYANGFKTKLILITGSRCPVDIYTAVKAQLAESGIDCEMQWVDTAKHNDYKFGGWENCMLYAGHVQEKDTYSSMDTFLSKKSRYWPSIARPAGWQEALEKAITTDDPKVAKEMAQFLVKMSYDEAMLVPFWRTGVTVFAAKSVQNDGWNKIDHQWWTPADCWLSK